MEVRVRNFDDSGREIVRKLEWHRVYNNTLLGSVLERNEVR